MFDGGGFAFAESVPGDIPDFDRLKVISDRVDPSEQWTPPRHVVTIEREYEQPVAAASECVDSTVAPPAEVEDLVSTEPLWQSARGPLRQPSHRTAPSRVLSTVPPKEGTSEVLGLPIAYTPALSPAPLIASSSRHQEPPGDPVSSPGVPPKIAEAYRTLLAQPRVPRRVLLGRVPRPDVPMSPSAMAAVAAAAAKSVNPSPSRTLGATAPSVRRRAGHGSRLPPLPSAAHLEERASVERLLKAMALRVASHTGERAEGGKLSGGFRGGVRGGATLDGFGLLKASKASHPRTAQHADISGGGYSEVVVEDLPFFEQLSALNCSDNSLPFESFDKLPRLAELHLACNSLTTVTVAPCAFLCLHTLNLAYNRVSVDSFVQLGMLPALRRLDLSHNGLRTLPPLSQGFPTLTHFALEGNKLRDDVVEVLVGAPYLVEVNLNGNHITSFARTPHGSFQRLSALGLADNKIATASAIAPLVELPALQRVALWGNPFCRALRTAPDAGEVLGSLAAQRVSVLTDGAVPPKRSAGEFLRSTVGGLATCEGSDVEVAQLARWVAASRPHPPWRASDPAKARDDAVDAHVRRLVLMEAELEDAEREAAHAAVEAAAVAANEAALAVVRRVQQAQQAQPAQRTQQPAAPDTLPAVADPRSTFFITAPSQS